MAEANGSLPWWIKLMSVAAVVFFILGFTLPRLLTPATPPPAAASQLDRFGPAPSFTLTDQTGQPFGDDQLEGQVWLADFFFTSCPGICPMLSANLQELYAQLGEEPWGDRVRIVSFSLDPERDTAEVLAEYAEAVGADPARWAFVRGPREEVWQLSEQGFKLAVDATPDDAANPIAHSGKIVLVDAAGQIRGYYDGLSMQGINQLRADLERVVVDGE